MNKLRTARAAPFFRAPPVGRAAVGRLVHRHRPVGTAVGRSPGRHRAVGAALLIEVLFSLSLLAFGITACLRALGQGLEVAKRSYEYYLAEEAADNLFFRLMSGADDDLLYDGGEGTLDKDAAGLDGVRFYVESKQISPYVPPTEEELLAMARSGQRVLPPELAQEVEERYRVLRIRLLWREGKEELDFYTIARITSGHDTR